MATAPARLMAQVGSLLTVDSRDACGGARVPVLESMICTSTSCQNVSVLTYKWQTAVGTEADLWLIDIDEDPRVAQWPSSTIARHFAVMCPAYGLLVDELDCGEWSRLEVFAPLSAIEQTHFPKNSRCDAIIYRSRCIVPDP